MTQKGTTQLALPTLVVAGGLLVLARTETTILEGALALWTTPLGAMIRDGSILANLVSMLLLVLIVRLCLGVLHDERLLRSMDRALRTHITAELEEHLEDPAAEPSAPEGTVSADEEAA